MTRKFFGTDGVRGPYGGPVVNEQFAAWLGHAGAMWLRGPGERRRVEGGTPQPALDRRNQPGIGRVLFGRDTRASGPSLEAAIATALRPVAPKWFRSACCRRPRSPVRRGSQARAWA